MPTDVIEYITNIAYKPANTSKCQRIPANTGYAAFCPMFFPPSLSPSLSPPLSPLFLPLLPLLFLPLLPPLLPPLFPLLLPLLLPPFFLPLLPLSLLLPLLPSSHISSRRGCRHALAAGAGQGQGWGKDNKEAVRWVSTEDWGDAQRGCRRHNTQAARHLVDIVLDLVSEEKNRTEKTWSLCSGCTLVCAWWGPTTRLVLLAAVMGNCWISESSW